MLSVNSRRQVAKAGKLRQVGAFLGLRLHIPEEIAGVGGDAVLRPLSIAGKQIGALRVERPEASYHFRM